jgi:hypothetical protein
VGRPRGSPVAKRTCKKRGFRPSTQAGYAYTSISPKQRSDWHSAESNNASARARDDICAMFR